MVQTVIAGILLLIYAIQEDLKQFFEDYCDNIKKICPFKFCQKILNENK